MSIPTQATKPSPPEFDASAWLTANCFGASRLRAETVRAISNFTLMWNLFEGVLCHGGANTSVLETVAEQVVQRCRHTNKPVDVQPFLSFWKFRYLTTDGFNKRFESLNFRRPDRRAHVEAVLRGEQAEPEAELLATLIVVYRLRDNLFHGLKTIAKLNDQVANLNMASRALAYVMESSGNHIIEPTVERRQLVASQGLNPPRTDNEQT